MKRTASKLVSIFLSLAMAFTTYANPSSFGSGSTVVLNQVSESLEIVTDSIEQLVDAAASGDIDLELMSEGLTTEDTGDETTSEDEPDPSVDDECPAGGSHVWGSEKEIIQSATCGAAGSKAYKCSNCGATSEVETIEATGEHAWGTEKEIIQAPTCGAPGSKAYKCSVCGATSEEETVDATGEHTWGEWTPTDDPNLEKHVCSVCFAEETQPAQSSGEDPVVYGITLNGSGIYEYGTSLRNIVAITGGEADFAPSANLDRVPDAGTHSGEQIAILVNGEERMLQIPEYIVTQATISSVSYDPSSNWDGTSFTLTYDASNPSVANEDAILSNLPGANNPYGGFTATYGNGETINLSATWNWDGGSPSFDPKGLAEGVYYTFSAQLSATGVNADNFIINISPKCYVYVNRVYLKQTLDVRSNTVQASSIETMSYLDFSALGLPSMASITQHSGSETSPYSSFSIVNWTSQDHGTLTIDVLKATASDAANRGESITLTLTPEYSDSAVPAWGTLETPPTFALTIEGKQMVTEEVLVSAPSSITYNGTLGNPIIDGVEVSGSTYEHPVLGTLSIAYEGINGTEYSSSVKPTKVGTYKVVVDLVSSTQYGHWESTSPSSFTIDPLHVWLNTSYSDYGAVLTGVSASKVYDGTTVLSEHDIDMSQAEIIGKVSSDDLGVTAASGYLTGYNAKDVGENKTAEISTISLTGNDKSNYVLDTISGSINTAKVTPRPLSIDTSNLEVWKILSTGQWEMKGQVQLIGVVDSEVSLDTTNMRVVDDLSLSAGTDQRITIENIAINNSFNLSNYSPNISGLHKAGETYYIVFERAEVYDKPIPKFGKDYNVMIPPNTYYDGLEREAVYIPITDGLPAPTFTYAMKLSNGYAEPSSAKPVQAGEYWVYANFKESDKFAAYTERVGRLHIDKIETYTDSRTITIPPAATKTINVIDDLGLTELVSPGAVLKHSLDIYTAKTTVKGDTGSNSFTLQSDSSSTNEYGAFTVALTSDTCEDITISVELILDTSMVNVTAPEPVLNARVFSGNKTLKDIVKLEGGSASRLGQNVPGTFSLKNPDEVLTPDDYTDYPIEVVFKSADNSYTETLTLRVTFIIYPEEFNINEFSPLDTIRLTVYANSQHNASADTLLQLLNSKKPTHVIDDQVYSVSWNQSVTNDHPQYNPLGSVTQNGTGEYLYTGVLQTKARDASPAEKNVKAYIKVIPINAVAQHETASKTVDASTIQGLSESNWKTQLGLPATVSASYVVENSEDALEHHRLPNAEKWSILGWKMDGKELTLSALKAKADSLASSGTVELTPIYAADGYASSPSWATVTGEPFKLTISKQTAPRGPENPPSKNPEGSGLVTTGWNNYNNYVWGEYLTPADIEADSIDEEVKEEVKEVQRPKTTTTTSRTSTNNKQDDFPFVPICIAGGVVILGLAGALVWKSVFAARSRKVVGSKAKK